jgi:hypothetical protein
LWESPVLWQTMPNHWRLRPRTWVENIRHSRHTFLTAAGEYTDPFTLQYVAGHDNIKTNVRYIHPREEAVRKLFVRIGGLERPEATVDFSGWVQNPVQWKTPSGKSADKY